MPNDTKSTFKDAFVEFSEFAIELAKVVLISLAIILPVRFYIVQPFYVNGQSMEPTFHNNEYLLIDEISYRFQEPQRGDIIVFRYPKDPSKFFIKRLIGLPGESVTIMSGRVRVVNEAHPEGFVLDESYLMNPSTLGDTTVNVGPHEYFVLGDNRAESLDSRIFGAVDKQYVIGRVWVRAFPFSRWAVFGNQTALLEPSSL